MIWMTSACAKNAKGLAERGSQCINTTLRHYFRIVTRIRLRKLPTEFPKFRLKLLISKTPFSSPTPSMPLKRGGIHHREQKAISTNVAAKCEYPNIALVAEDLVDPQHVRLYTTSFICAATSNTDPGKLP